ncbi:MAG: dihydropteroate synthase [Proteobacteria bacterium]|nr:dihydropteroate synthase [Pseudomonadota bacterium]
MNDFLLSFKEHKLKLGTSTCIMGILNVTPDSFSDGGRFFKTSQAVSRAQQMVEEGADIIDIGGESTRPYAKAVSLSEEINRVIPVIEQLAKKIHVPISVDTTKAEVARRAIEAGASIVNDISAMEMDPDMASVVATSKVPVVLMHMMGTPGTMQDTPHYHDPVKEIYAYLESAIQKAEQQGISRSMIIADPGIGFGKTMAHNFILLKHLRDFSSLNVPILVGSSRKAFIRNTVSTNTDKDMSHAIEIGTQATVSAAILGGAHMVRVHDVASTQATVKIIDALKNA